MKAKRIVSAYYIISALMAGSMGFTMGVYSSFLRSAGLDEFWVNMVNVIYFITITFCEIPTGLFADIFGRKWSLVASCLLQSGAFCVYGMSRSFGGFVLAEIICATGRTFASGAFNAWLVDSLKMEGGDHNLHHIFTKRSLFSGAATILMAILGGRIGNEGLNLPFYCGSALFLVTGIVATVILKETYFVRTAYSFTKGLQEIRDIWKRSKDFARSDMNFRFVLVISGLQMFAVMAPNMEWQEVFKQFGFTHSDNGILAAIIIAVITFGAYFSRKLSPKVANEKRQMVAIQVLIGLFIILTVSCTSIYPILTYFFIHEIARGMSGPIMETYSQRCITSSKEKATLSSVSSMASHFGGFAGLIICGLIAKYVGIPAAWIVSGSFLIITTLVVARNHK